MTPLRRFLELALIASVPAARVFAHEIIILIFSLINKASIGVYFVSRATLLSSLLRDDSCSSVMSRLREPEFLIIPIAISGKSVP